MILISINDVNSLPKNKNIKAIVLDYKINGNKLTINTKQGIIVYYFKDNQELGDFKIGYGYYIEVQGSYRDYQKSTIPYNFNNKIYQKLNGNSYYFEANKINVKPTKILWFKIKNKYFNHLKQYDNYDYYLALMMGNKSYLDGDLENMYSVNGISHLLAMSGLHLGLFMFGINYFLKILHIKKTRHIIIFGLFLFLLLFMTNYNPSLLRAALFFIYLKINKKYKIVDSNNKVLWYVLITCLIINKQIIFNIGFIYSILCTMALINYKFSKSKLLSLLEISLVTMLVSAPITIKLNHSINLLSFICNLVLVPYMSYILLPLVILSSLVSFLNPLGSLFIEIFNYINKFFYNINIFKITIPDYSVIFLLLYYITFYFFLKKKKVLVGLIIILLVIKIIPYFNTGYIITYLDVGQGDSSLIVSPHLKDVVMIDTGGKVRFNNDFVYYKKSMDISKTINYLKGLGITKISYLIITHGDFDHMGEAINLVNNFKVEKVIFNCGPYNNLEQELIKVLDEKKINYYSCIKELNVDKNKLYFLQTKEYDSENDNSNVIYTVLNGYKFMFMGDASVTTEKEILDKYNLSNIDVLKVGHHGSKTSSSKEFINEINPNYSIISVGKNNRYGHPNKEVLDNLKDSKIYRTDQDGSIMFKIKNNNLKIETCSP